MANGVGIELSLVGDVEVKFDGGGIIALFTSPGMAAACGSIAERIAAAANAASSDDPMDAPPFDGRAIVLDRTAIGSVSTVTPHGFRSKERIIDNAGAGVI